MRTLLFLTLSGTALALLLLALRYLLLRRMPSTVYYYAWLLVLLRFALPLPGLVPGAAGAESASVAAARVPSAYIETEQAAELPPPEADPGILGPDSAPLAEAPLEAYALPEELPPTPAPARPAAESEAVRPDWRSPRLWLGVWAAGALVSLCVPAVSYLRFRAALGKTLRAPSEAVQRQYDAIPGRKCALSVSDAVKTPLTVGLFAPRIVLPASIGAGELLDCVLRHELTHVRRRDILYKWLAVVVFSAHWFNPLVYVLRRELDRACELSCDETLLRAMTHAERRAYGDTLLQVAASGALPVGVVATTFATEKKNLKERLEQIMTYKKSTARVLAAVLALALLAGCGVAAGPAAETAPPSAAPAETPRPAPTGGGGGEVHVSTVDELLAAIAPDSTIVLAPGDYDLSTAADYGHAPEGAFYAWGPAGEKGFELLISNVDNLTIRGEDPETTRLLVEPRYANVLHFDSCVAVRVEGLTAGHTDGAYCTGGVLRFYNCEGVSVTDCGLFGCGTIGVWAEYCRNVSVKGSHIYECSVSAVSVNRCRNVRVEDCDVYDHGLREGQGAAMNLFNALYSDGFVVYNNRVWNNDAQYLLNCAYTRNAFFLSNDVHENKYESAVFAFEQYPCVVDGCAFDDDSRFWVLDHSIEPVGVDGLPLDAAALESMTHHDSDPDIVFPSTSLEAATEVAPGGSITVRTADEFVRAIGPDRTIILDGALFDLSTASSYGSTGGEYYYWQESVDGPELVVEGVSGLSIIAAEKDAAATTIAAIPRYANVLHFKSCSAIDLIGFTAGHTEEPGYCSGGVLYFEDCHRVRVEHCRLYGCGVLGVQTMQGTDFEINETEIFDCSLGAGQFFQTDGICFTGCDVHDVPSPAFRFRECGDVTWDGVPVAGNRLDVDASGAVTQGPVPTPMPGGTYAGPELSLGELLNPFAGEPAQPLDPDSPEGQFAAELQRCIADGDWSGLAGRCCYPLHLFIGDTLVYVYSPEELLELLADDEFLAWSFTPGFRKLIADASLDECGQCTFGTTVLEHRVAFVVNGDGSGNGAGQYVPEDFRVSCIAFPGPLWPGRAE